MNTVFVQEAHRIEQTQRAVTQALFRGVVGMTVTAVVVVAAGVPAALDPASLDLVEGLPRRARGVFFLAPVAVFSVFFGRTKDALLARAALARAALARQQQDLAAGVLPTRDTDSDETRAWPAGGVA